MNLDVIAQYQYMEVRDRSGTNRTVVSQFQANLHSHSRNMRQFLFLSTGGGIIKRLNLKQPDISQVLQEEEQEYPKVPYQYY